MMWLKKMVCLYPVIKIKAIICFLWNYLLLFIYLLQLGTFLWLSLRILVQAKNQGADFEEQDVKEKQGGLDDTLNNNNIRATWKKSWRDIQWF